MKNGIKEIATSFVWGPISLDYPGLVRGGRTAWEMVRAYYYTYFTASDDIISKHTKAIKQVPIGKGYTLKLSPVVFKKNKSDRDVKGDDIALTVEALHHAYNRNVDVIHIFTGDGDYVPLIDEIKHLGITVFVSAFSSGLNDKIEECADMFFNLDDEFFEKDE